MSRYPTRLPSTGVVSSFDVDRGIGEIESDDGRVVAFHCTAISDGTRDIPVHARVVFVTEAGHLGRMEARGVSSLQSSAS